MTKTLGIKLLLISTFLIILCAVLGKIKEKIIKGSEIIDHITYYGFPLALLSATVGIIILVVSHFCKKS